MDIFKIKKKTLLAIMLITTTHLSMAGDKLTNDKDQVKADDKKVVIVGDLETEVTHLTNAISLLLNQINTLKSDLLSAQNDYKQAKKNLNQKKILWKKSTQAYTVARKTYNAEAIKVKLLRKKYRAVDALYRKAMDRTYYANTVDWNDYDSAKAAEKVAKKIRDDAWWALHRQTNKRDNASDKMQNILEKNREKVNLAHNAYLDAEKAIEVKEKEIDSITMAIRLKTIIMKQKISIRDKKKISLSKHKVPKIKTKTVKAMYLKSIVATTKVNKMSDNIPKIKQFTVHQGDNISKGRIITISGGNVAVSAMVSGKENANAYEWNSADFSAVNGNNHQAIFVFDPSALDSGTRTISLTVTTNGRSSTRVLTLKLVGKYPLNWKDADNNGISDDKELKHTSNQLLAGVHTKITSPIGTKLLTGVMGENSGRLTLARMKQYVAVNSLPNNTKDTLITGDIYDFVVESLSTAGASTQVIIELATTIPENAELRKYSLTNGWANFVVDTDNIVQSKTSDACTDASTWKTGLITGATCLKLTIKDGGENDTDDQTNGVIESTISIATPSVLYDDIRNNCIHNPNVYDGPYVVDFKCLLY